MKRCDLNWPYCSAMVVAMFQRGNMLTQINLQQTAMWYIGIHIYKEEEIIHWEILIEMI